MRKNNRTKNMLKLKQSVIETMERRLLMSSVVLSGGTLTITGSAAADMIEVNYDIYNSVPDQNVISVTLNGLTQRFNGQAMNKLVINAGDGNNTVNVTGSQDNYINIVPDLAMSITGGSGNDTITTRTTAEDYVGNTVTINTGNGNNSVDADFDGLATITGGSGNDTLGAAFSADKGDAHATIYGGDGNDYIYSGGSGYAYVTAYGQGGNDTFENGDPDNRIYADGGSGTNTFLISSDPLPEFFGTVIPLDSSFAGGSLTNIQNVAGYADGNLTIIGNSSNNDIEIADRSGVVSLVGGGGNDTLNADYHDSTVAFATAYLDGGTGNDLLTGGLGVNHFSGGTGTDTVDYSTKTANLQIYLDGSQKSGDPTQTGAYDFTTNKYVTGANDTFDGTVEKVYGGSGDDLIVGTPANNVLFGNAGNDTLVSNGGSDALFGGTGNDTFRARDGGNTYIDGGPGIDTAMTDLTDTEVNVESINPGLPAPVRLTGSAIGTMGSYHNDGNTIAKVFDGSLSTYFDAPVATGGYAGLDLGAAKVVNQVSFAPRPGFESRMVGGQFQGSNSAIFSAAVTLYTITFNPVAGALTTAGFINTTAYRYVRYVGPANSYCNIAAAQFFTATLPFARVESSGNLVVTGTQGADTISVYYTREQQDNVTTGSFAVTENGVTENFGAAGISGLVVNSLDGNDTVYINGDELYDGQTSAPHAINVSVNGGSGNDSTQVYIADANVASPGYGMGLGTSTSITAGDGNDTAFVQGGVNATITFGNGNDMITTASNTDDLRVVMTAGNGNDTLVAGSAGNAGQVVSMFAGSGEDSFLNTDINDHVGANKGLPVDYFTSTLTGTVSSTVANDHGNGPVLVYLDNNNNGVFDSGDTSQMVPLGGSYTFSGLPNLSAGSGVFPDYTVGIVTPAGYQLVQPASGNSYTYIESGSLVTGYNFILKPTSALLTGTVIGTPGSYRNHGNTDANAFDGNLNTYFDAPTPSGSYAGLDLETAKIITRISYAPRTGLESRMVGGIFQGSNSADFSSGNVTLYTITSVPAAGALTAVSITNWSAYRYVRYVGPANSYCNVAEVQFYEATPTTGATLESDGTLVVNGTESADTIHVNLAGYGGPAAVTVNGAIQTISGATVTLNVQNTQSILQSL